MFDIIVKNTKNPTEDLKELAIIMVKLRYHTKKWKTEYGSPNRVNMETWQNKADEWISKHIRIQNKD